ncbi:MAG: hypothetical protein ACBZ72_02260 [Candidatus Bathyarchaeia archaeon]
MTTYNSNKPNSNPNPTQDPTTVYTLMGACAQNYVLAPQPRHSNKTSHKNKHDTQTTTKTQTKTLNT